MVSIADLVARTAVVCWVLCIFFRLLAAQLAPAPAPARARTCTARRPASPAALEWRKVRRLPFGRLVAIRLQVILA